MFNNYSIALIIYLIIIGFLSRSRFFGVPFGDALSYVVGSIKERESGERTVKLINTYGIYNAVLSKISKKSFYSYTLPGIQLFLILLLGSSSKLNLDIICWGVLIFLLINLREGVHLVTPAARFFGNYTSWLVCCITMLNDPSLFVLGLLIAISIFSGKFWLQNGSLLIFIILTSDITDVKNKLLFLLFLLLALKILGVMKKISEQFHFLKYEYRVQIAFGNDISKFKKRDIKRLLGWIPALMAVSLGMVDVLGYFATVSYFIFVILVFLTPLKIIGVAERYIISFTPFVLVDYKLSILYTLSLIVFLAAESRRFLPIWKNWNNRDAHQLLERLNLGDKKIIIAESVRMADYIKYVRDDLDIVRVNIGDYSKATSMGIINHNKKFNKITEGCKNYLVVHGLHPVKIRDSLQNLAV